jgi:protein-tyrosine phosphatase
MRLSVIFVCYENICRSPMAEGIFSDLLVRHNLQQAISVTSAGTVGYQQGSAPDERAVAAVSALGIDISSVRARSVDELDMRVFDWIFVMDHGNYEEISRYLTSQEGPRLHLALDFVEGRSGEAIEDPYYGTSKEFDRVVDDLVLASRQILLRLLEEYPDIAMQASILS